MADLPYVVTHSHFSYFYFQTVNTLSMNAVYPKTFLGVSKRTQKPKGVARLVIPIAFFSCMLCPRQQVHLHRFLGRKGLWELYTVPSWRRGLFSDLYLVPCDWDRGCLEGSGGRCAAELVRSRSFEAS